MSKSLQLIPQEGEDPEASFRALGKNFDLDPQVVQLLLKSHLKNFEEFRFFFSDEASVESFLAKIDLKGPPEGPGRPPPPGVGRPEGILHPIRGRQVPGARE